MQYIAAKIDIDATGHFAVEKGSVRSSANLDPLRDEVAGSPGNVVAVWRYLGEADMSNVDDAERWIGMVRPENLYMRSDWAEFLELDGHYAPEVETS